MTAQTWVLVLGVGSALLSVAAALVGLPSFRRPPLRGQLTYDDIAHAHEEVNQERHADWVRGWRVTVLALFSAAFAMGAAVVGFVAA
ncbi:hypothetical protein [Kineococcus rhizosphaerae]|uniref:Uncharacterized protein n=1 Tax=Kineococcus rhizosphaerae TaxID=559628 RepID=A0A2T0QNC2_9ACTN|nr:hypothetical protein [Kineococcus rhizosphaerae]PRY06097.1 hypothetical protein CLV37_13512 [Kineococcus rhizosphaerae]